MVSSRFVMVEMDTMLAASTKNSAVLLAKKRVLQTSKNAGFILQFICVLESQVVECSMGSFYTQRF